MRKNLQKIAGSVAQSGVELAGKNALALGRTTWLATLGLAASAGEAGVELFDHLVAKGRRRSESPTEKARRAVTETGSQVAKLAGDVTRVARQQATDLLARLGLPGRADLQTLVSRVERLRQKLV
ncbi:MAG: phasin family protein [Thermoanaerobaculia bacterium]